MSPRSMRRFLLMLLPAALCWAAGETRASAPLTAPMSQSTGVRLLVVGLDGADWQIAGPLMEAGRMPNLARLKREGSWCDLRSIIPTLSPLLWTSIATGKPPDQHGIVDFLVRDRRTGQMVPIASTFRRTKALWNIYSDAGRTADFIGWWATWPAETINGHMISDRFAYSLFGYRSRPEDTVALVHPPGFLDAIAPLRVDDSLITLRDLQRFVEITPDDLAAARGRAGQHRSQRFADPIDHLARILASTRTYHAVALKLLKEGKPDILSIYYQGIDEVCHRFAQYIPPRRGWVDPELFAKYRDAVPRFYEYQDELLGQLLEAAGTGVTVMVVSDHGFFSGSDRPDFPPDIELKASAWHRPYGIFLLRGPDIRSGRLEPASLYDVAPTILYLAGLPVPADMTGRPLLDVAAPEFAARVRLSSVPSYETGEGRSAEVAPPVSSAEVDEEILAKLRSLGYIAASEIATKPGTEAGQAPATLTNLRNMASLQLKAGDYQRAEETARSMLRHDQESSDGHALLSEAMQGQGRLDEALREARTALNLTPDPSDGLVGRFTQLSRRLGRLEEAKEFLLRYAQGRPGRPEPWTGLGTAQALESDWKAAEASFLRALDMNPRSAAALTGLFNVYQRGGRSPAIRDRIEKATSSNPDSAAHHTLLGMIDSDVGNLDKAELELKRALELDPEQDAAIAAMGDLLLKKGRPGDARRLLEQAVARRADQVEVRMALGRVYSKMSRFGEAMREFNEAERLEPDSPLVQGQLGLILIMQGKDEEAIPHLTRALELDPSLFQLRLHLALLYHGRGRLPECEEQLHQAIALRPDDPEPHRLLADLYQRTGRPAEAEKERLRLKELTGNR